jgi:hypothetical protein
VWENIVIAKKNRKRGTIKQERMKQTFHFNFLFIVYLTTLSITQTMGRRMARLMNNQVKRIFEKSDRDPICGNIPEFVWRD